MIEAYGPYVATCRGVGTGESVVSIYESGALGNSLGSQVISDTILSFQFSSKNSLVAVGSRQAHFCNLDVDGLSFKSLNLNNRLNCLSILKDQFVVFGGMRGFILLDISNPNLLPNEVPGDPIQSIRFLNESQLVTINLDEVDSGYSNYRFYDLRACSSPILSWRCSGSHRLIQSSPIAGVSCSENDLISSFEVSTGNIFIFDLKKTVAPLEKLKCFDDDSSIVREHDIRWSSFKTSTCVSRSSTSGKIVATEFVNLPGMTHSGSMLLYPSLSSSSSFCFVSAASSLDCFALNDSTGTVHKLHYPKKPIVLFNPATVSSSGFAVSTRLDTHFIVNPVSNQECNDDDFFHHEEDIGDVMKRRLVVSGYGVGGIAANISSCCSSINSFLTGSVDEKLFTSHPPHNQAGIRRNGKKHSPGVLTNSVIEGNRNSRWSSRHQVLSEFWRWSRRVEGLQPHYEVSANGCLLLREEMLIGNIEECVESQLLFSIVNFKLSETMSLIRNQFDKKSSSLSKEFQRALFICLSSSTPSMHTKEVDNLWGFSLQCFLEEFSSKVPLDSFPCELLVALRLADEMHVKKLHKELLIGVMCDELSSGSDHHLSIPTCFFLLKVCFALHNRDHIRARTSNINACQNTVDGNNAVERDEARGGVHDEDGGSGGSGEESIHDDDDEEKNMEVKEDDGDCKQLIAKLIDKVSEYSVKWGLLQNSVIVYSSRGVDGVSQLLKRFLEITSDVQTIAAIAVLCVPSHSLLSLVFRESLLVDAFFARTIQSYISLLNQWGFWPERMKVRSLLSTAASFMSRDRKRTSTQYPFHVLKPASLFCYYCQSPLTGSVSASSVSNSILSNTTSNSSSGNHHHQSLSSSACSPAPVQPLFFASSQAFPFASSSLSISLRCPNSLCHKPVPNCSVCLGPIFVTTTPPTPSSSALLSAPVLQIDHWTTWCGRCRHGGHQDHLIDWFSEYDECPVAGCSCMCNMLDG